MNKKFIILATVFVDVLGMGIIIPTLPFYVESFGVSAFTITMLFCIFAFFSFFSAPILGSLSDKYGRRPVMIASIFSTAIGWLVFASATNLWLLFLGRTIDGLAAGNFSTAQGIMTDIAKDEKDRTKNLGMMGAVFGIAFIIGPAIGGLLSNISPTFPFWIVGFMAILNLINVIFNLPETHTIRNSDSKISLNPLMPIIRILRDRMILPRFSVWFLFGLTVSIQQAVFALYLGKVFSLGAFASGVFLTGLGVIITLNQGFLLSKFWLKRFKESQLELIMTVIFAIGFLLMSTSLLGIFIAGLIFITFGQSVLRVVLTSQIAGNSHERRGEVLGAMTSAMSVAMIIGPLMGGALFVSHTKWPFLISGILSVISFFILVADRKSLKKVSPIIEPVNDQTIV